MLCQLRFLSLRVEVSLENALPDESDVYFFSFWFCCCWASIFFSSSFTFFWRSFTSFCTSSTFFSKSSWATSTFFFRSSTFFFSSVTSFLACCFLASTFFFTSCRAWPWSGTSPHPATNATSTSTASTPSNARTFVTSRIVLFPSSFGRCAFSCSTTCPILTYGQTKMKRSKRGIQSNTIVVAVITGGLGILSGVVASYLKFRNDVRLSNLEFRNDLKAEYDKDLRNER